MSTRIQEIAALTVERVTLQEVLSTLRELACHEYGDAAGRVYRDLIQLFENREKAVAFALNKYIERDALVPA